MEDRNPRFLKCGWDEKRWAEKSEIPIKMSSPSSAAVAVDPTPLLRDEIFLARRRRGLLSGPPSLRDAANFLRRASNRSRALSEPSVRVRETAAEVIEERQREWAFSKPIVISDLFRNILFIFVSILVLFSSKEEITLMPLRLWAFGYALLCVLHAGCVCYECWRRQLEENSLESEGGQLGHRRDHSNPRSGSDNVVATGYFSDHRRSECEESVAKHLESASGMFSFIWWVIGVYWVYACGERLFSEAPQLYWLCWTFLLFDAFFVFMGVAVACVIGIGICCCLPCIIAILNSVADPEVATQDDIGRLPRYRFRKNGDSEKQNGGMGGSFGGIMTECDTDSPLEHVLPVEDAECCICLCAYNDGTELHRLPCRHHFHSHCIERWLFIKATCPLCKLNIRKNGIPSGTQEA